MLGHCAAEFKSVCPARPMGKPLIYCHLSKYFAGSRWPAHLGGDIWWQSDLNRWAIANPTKFWQRRATTLGWSWSFGRKKISYPSSSWNGFIRYLVEERFKFLPSENLTEEQRLGFMKWLGADSAELMRYPPLPAADLAKAKKLFPQDTDFKSIQLEITIDNHRFRKALNLNRAIFLKTITFTNCCFERRVGFFDANFELGASFSSSKFLDEVDFGRAQFRAGATFDSVTFCGPVRFYCHRPDNYFVASFDHALFKTMPPIFHG